MAAPYLRFLIGSMISTRPCESASSGESQVSTSRSRYFSGHEYQQSHTGDHTDAGGVDGDA
ncbi:MAG TPA: hypothetical protein HPP94_13195 [Desulfuromonadales bacterium]|nr:hypothetical protein [Desulfuromonadales bacterium]